MALCYFQLKPVVSERGVLASSHNAVLNKTVDGSNPLTFEMVLDRLTIAAVRLLGAAFDCKNFNAVPPLANAWTDALLAVKSKPMLTCLVDRRGRELRDILTADDKTPVEKFRDAGNLASVGIELPATAIERCRDAEMLADGLAQLLADALNHAATDDSGNAVRSQDIFHVLNAFLTMFRAALDPPNRARVELLAHTGAKIVVESVKTENDGLIANMDRLMQAVRKEAKVANMMDVVQGVLEKKRKKIRTTPVTTDEEDKAEKDKDQTADGNQAQAQRQTQDQQEDQANNQEPGQKHEEKTREKKETKDERINRNHTSDLSLMQPKIVDL